MQELIIDTEAENKEIVRRYRKLMRAAKPVLKDGDAKIIRKAFNMSLEAHKDMRRKSGEPYIYHPIAVAEICIEEIGLGTTSIVAALLHDVVEDSEIELSEIEREFGPKVAQIIAGLTKISTVVENGVSAQAENFKKILLTLSEDIRVVLVKLADRLHNMRTLESMSRDKQLKIASETIYLYAPLAHRLGLNLIKTELEDYWLKYTHEEDYKEIAKLLNQTRASRNKFVKDFINPLQRELDKTGFEYRIFGRPKSIYSIYNKTKKQNTPFDQVYDLFAIRIVLDVPSEQEKSACWHIYSVVTDLYKPNPDRLRDWVSTSKSNGYESLHTTVMSNSGQWVEVQIRSERMDQIAEKGYAAHWKYKEHGSTSSVSERGLEMWISKVRDALQQYNHDAMEFVDEFRNNLLSDEIYVFTPKGDLKTLTKGATALDFAFEIHTQIGVKCIGAKVNQKLVPLNYTLNNGDQVEILTSNKQKPTEDWLNFVTTSRARAKIKERLKEEFKNIAADGKEIVLRKLDHVKLTLNPDTIQLLLDYFGEKNIIDLFYKVAKNIIDSTEIKRALTTPRVVVPKEDVQDKKTFVKELSKIRGEAADTLLIGENMDKLDYTLAKCCNPIPGDDVFGFVTVSEGIKIHRTTCPNAVELMSNYGYRIIKARWTSQEELAFMAGLTIIGGDRLGMINDITQVVSLDLHVNIRSITIDSVDGMFEGKIVVYVENTLQLSNLIDKLKAIAGIISVNRFDS